LIAAILFAIWFIQVNWRSGIDQMDTTRDGKPDTWHHYQRGAITKIEEDNNADGRADAWWFYTDGIISHGKRDADFNGIPDVTIYFQNGRISRAEWHPNGAEILAKKEVYRDGSIIEEWIDENRDGRFNRLIKYDWMGNISSTQEL
jgi:hypothetical protein